MKEEYTDAVSASLFMLFMAFAVYAGLFSEVIGFNNIGLTALWIVGVLLLIGSVAEVKNPPQNNGQMNKYIQYTLRTIYVLLVLAIIYKGEIVLGIFYIMASLSEYGKRIKYQKQQKEQANV